MAVAVVFEWDGATVEQYDQVNDEMGHLPGTTGPDGALFHWMTVTDTGIRITDVWETREQFEQFAATKIMPAVAKFGIESQPRIEFYDVHNYLIGSPTTVSSGA